jgi:ATP-dependent Lon protease
MIKIEDAFERTELGQAANSRQKTLDSICAHQIFDDRKIGQLLGGLNEETKYQLLKLKESGPLRHLIQVPDDYVERCLELESRFPNFSVFINEMLLPALALSHIRKTGLHIPPVVFVGSPGVGKTMFVSELAAVFDLDFERLNLETSQSSMELVGASRGWSNAQPGNLFRWLGRVETANGIFVLEELDKSDTQHSRYPVTNSLLQLLEKTTARVFSDQSLPELKLDITKINFLFTANTVEGISEPILSRVHVVDIPDLTAEQAKAVALRQYETMIEELRLPISAPKLTESGLEVLSRESPRRQRLLLQLAIGSAVFKKAQELQIQPTQKVRRRGIGFTC